MTAKEAAIKMHDEALETIIGAINQGFEGEDLKQLVRNLLEEDLEKILKELQ